MTCDFLKVLDRIAQVGSLRVVEDDLVRSGSDLNRFFRLRRRITVNRYRLFRYRFSERLIPLGLFRKKRMTRDFLKVLDRIAQVGSLRVIDVDHVLAGSNRQRIRRRAVVVVAVNINLFVYRRDHSPERLILHGLCVEHSVRALINVVHRVAQIGLWH